MSGAGVWTRRLIQLLPIQKGVVYLALDNAGDVWELLVKQGHMAELRPISLWQVVGPVQSNSTLAPWPPKT